MAEKYEHDRKTSVRWCRYCGQYFMPDPDKPNERLCSRCWEAGIRLVAKKGGR